MGSCLIRMPFYPDRGRATQMTGIFHSKAGGASGGAYCADPGKEAEGVSADLSKRERAVSGKRIWNTAKRRLQHSGGGAWGNLPGHIFPHKADRSVRRKNRHKPTILPIHCGKDGLAEGTCDL